MISKDDLLKSLKNKTVTLGWDAVAIYDREHTNMLMEQQYVRKMAEGSHFPSFSKTITDVGNSQKIVMDSMLFGAPLISFEDSNIESSYVKVRIEFVSGTISLISGGGNITIINRIDDINSVNGYAIELKVALENVNGSIDKQGQVQINFASSSLLNVTFPGMVLPAIVMDLFRDYFKNNPVTYVINTIDVSGDNILTPQKFIVRTQSAPGATQREAANYGNGAVLVFIATRANPSGGNYPANNYPWLLPVGSSSTLVLSSRVLFSDIIKPNIDSLFDKGQWALARVDESVKDSAYYLKVDSASIINEPLTMYVNNKEVWTGSVSPPPYKKILKDVELPFKHVSLLPNSTGFELSVWGGEKFDVDFGARWYHCETSVNGQTCGDSYFNYKYDFYFTNSVHYKAEDSNNNDVIFKKTDGSIYVMGDYEPPTWWHGTWEKELSDEFSSIITKKMERFNKINIPEIKVSLIQHLIFSSDVEIKISDIYVPGDMVLFGALAPKSTAFRIDPLRSVVGLNTTKQFTVTPERSVKWAMSPSLGEINAVTGLYTAPAGTLKEDKTLILSATDSTGAVAIASVVLTESSTALTPTFISVQETALQIESNDLLEYTWFSTNGSQPTSWSLDSNLPQEARGTISPAGRYTPPTKYVEGANIVTVTALGKDAKAAHAYICLKHKLAKEDLKFEPEIHPEVGAGETVEFMVTSTDFELSDENWKFYPTALGKWQVDAIESGEDEVYQYRVKYTAPEIITQREMAFVNGKISNKRFGIGAVILVPGTNNWDLVTSIEELSISLLTGADKGAIFANGRCQLPVAVHVKGLNANDDDREVPLSLGDIIGHIELVDYTTGEPLRYEESRGWFYTLTKNEFQTLPENTARALQGNNQLYVMCDSRETLRTKRVALRVTLTSPDADKKVYWTGINSGIFDSSVVVNAQEAINYSYKDNLLIINNELQSISQAMAWDYKRGSYYAEKSNGEYLKKRIDIKPANVSRFHSVEIEQHSVWNADLNPEVIRWDGEVAHSFSAIDSSGVAPVAAYATNSHAVVGDDEYTELNIWYAQQEQPADVKIKGSVYFVNTDHDDPEYYGQRMRPDFADQRQLAETEGRASFYLYKLRLGKRSGANENDQPQIDINGKPNHWQEAIPEIKVSVVDIYGNSGSFIVYWNTINSNSSDADKPLIK
ncbi:hypothetical protein F0W99_20675 [Salmonella enterica]|nr:hypothetical protein [Salmonella enterica]ECR9187063.1 hypothetical protein [Salmonella enterica]EJJ1214695.1 hypothetical protein [Salmonella enterica]EJJ8220022.1 hypothetical protein [Salmonella enterica]EJT4054747.1 hypothetical protein [Salmonella enterica]